MRPRTNRATAAIGVITLALAFGLQSTTASAAPRRQRAGDALAIAAFAAIMGTIAAMAAEERRERNRERYYGYDEPSYDAPPGTTGSVCGESRISLNGPRVWPC